MSTIDYAIRMEFGRFVPNVFTTYETLGQTEVWKITTSTTPVIINNETYYGGYISKDAIGDITKRIDISQGGTYAYDANTFNFSIRNGGSSADHFSVFSNDILNAYQINATGAKIQVWAIEDGTPLMLWNGYVTDTGITDTKVTFSCKTDNKVIHGLMADEEFSTLKFPYMEDKYLGKTMPECVGTVPRAKLYPIVNKRVIVKNIWTNFDERDMYDDQHREQPTSVTPVKAISADGSTIIVFRGRTGDGLSAFEDKTGKYLEVLLGDGKGERRRIIANKVIQKGSKMLIQYASNVDGLMHTLSRDEADFQIEYEMFTLGEPFDTDGIVPIDNYPVIGDELLTILDEDASDIDDEYRFTEVGINLSKFTDFEDSEEQVDVNNLMGFSSGMNKQYILPTFGLDKRETTDATGDDTITFASVEKLEEWKTQGWDPEVDQEDNYLDVAGLPISETGESFPNGMPYMTIAPGTSYVCVASYDSELVVSTNTVNTLAYGGEQLLYHDEDFGEIVMNELVGEINSIRANEKYPSVKLSGDSVSDKPNEMLVTEYLAPSKVILTQSTQAICDTAARVEVALGSEISTAINRNSTSSTKVITIDGGTPSSTVTGIQSKFVAEFDVYIDDIEEYQAYETLTLGGRLRISPSAEANDSLDVPLYKNINSRIEAAKTTIMAVDVNGNVIRNTEQSSIYVPYAPRTSTWKLDQANSRYNVTLGEDNGDLTGSYRFEGLTDAYFQDSPGLTPDLSSSSGDVTYLIKEKNVVDIIKCFRVRYEGKLRAHKDGSGRWSGTANSWAIHIDDLGFTATKKVDTSRLSTNCIGLNGYDSKPATLIRNTLAAYDPDVSFNNASFLEANNNFHTSYYGRQLTASEYTYTTYNEICNNSMLGMWTNNSNELAIKYWLQDLETEPTIIHNEENIITNSVNIEPNIYENVYTVYNFQYMYDSIAGEYLKEMHIRNAEQDAFPEEYLREESEDILNYNGLPSYILAISFSIDYTAANKLASGVGGIGYITVSTLSGINDEDMAELGFDYDKDLIIRGGTQGDAKYCTVLDFTHVGNTYTYKVEQLQASSFKNSFSTVDFVVNKTSSDEIWTRYCNALDSSGNLDYGRSKQLWEGVHATYSQTKIKTEAPSDMTVLDWVHRDSDFIEYRDRLMYWAGYSKSSPSYSIPLTATNWYNTELLNWVNWEDAIHTHYSKYEINDDGTPTGEVSTIRDRNGWITDFTISPKTDSIAIKLILDKEKTDSVVIDENTNPTTEDTVQEDNYYGDDTINESGGL